MAKIYAKADYLVVWLGVGDRKIDICLRLLETFMELEESGVLDPEQGFDKWLTASVSHANISMVYETLNQVYVSTWFHRAWIVQEYFLGAIQARFHVTKRNPVLFCQGRRRFRDLISKAVALDGFRTKNPYSDFESYNLCRLHSMRTLYRILPIRGQDRVGADSAKGQHLLKAVVQSMPNHATDPRDKIYSCLGVVDAYFNDDFGNYAPDGLILDYGASVQDVYSNFVRAITKATKRLDMLSLCDGKRTRHIQRTWTPGW